MRVVGVTLSDFRNFRSAAADFDPGINVITGENAQGKTNLLEAVYIMTGGKSFRTRFDRELIAFDADTAEIKGDIEAGARRQEIKIRISRGRKKQIWQNGVSKTASDMSGALTAVLFCPDDLNLIRDGAAARRRMMDMAIGQLRSGYSKLLSEFTRIYEHKTRILRDFREKPSLLETLDDFSDGLCRCSAGIIRYRASFARRLGGAAGPIHGEFSGGREELSLSYRTMKTVEDPTAPLDELYAAVKAHQKEHREEEIQSGLCLTGAHKDDLEIEINGRAARTFASQGQARTAALSLKLAERDIFRDETGEFPVLLLDDVLSELDARRQEFVLRRITGGQTLITCCEDDGVLGRTGGRVQKVSAGEIRHLS